jgi:4-amino-4-deoxy-L-arabinose transferase-like glycosyltransferase
MFSFMRYINQQRVWWLLSFGVSFSLALLLKPTAIFFLPPLIAYALLKLPIKVRVVVPWMLTMFLSAIPLLLWRVWILNFPEGIPASNWLLNGNNIRLKPAFFRWLFAERLAKLILGYYGIVLLLMGYMYTVKGLSRRLTPADYLRRIKSIVRRFSHAETLTHTSLSQVFYLTWTLGMLLYLIVIASGNVQHDYYQIVLLPLISILVARGIMFFLDQHTLTALILMLLCVVSMIGFSWYEVKGYFNINNWAMVRAGEAVDRLTPADALVIAPYMGDTAFLYQTNRRGWPIGFDIEDKISKGAAYYVSTSLDDEARELASRYQVLEQTDEYILIHLTK